MDDIEIREEKPRTKFTWPRVNDPENLALNGLRALGVGRIWFMPETGEILAMRDVRNVPVEDPSGKAARGVPEALVRMTEQHAWPAGPITLLHLRTMSAIAKTEIPEPSEAIPDIYVEPQYSAWEGEFSDAPELSEEDPSAHETSTKEEA